MISDQIRQAEDAARFLTRVLSGFNESNTYDTYKEVEHFTDEEYEEAIDTLTEFGNGMGVTELANSTLAI
ncbi:hypothetical protein LCGC14_0288530 [marine sediment metagenome]|uniref:Uncharacterized protein n=1 Tax=marine sediment metagenome TaxID=412755 RepID=A0A0F9WEU8_9ZZZZ